MQFISTNPGKRRSYLLQGWFISFCIFVQLSLEDRIVKSQVLCFVTKDYCVGRASISKLSKQLAFVYPLSNLHQVMDSWNLSHSYFHDANASNFGVVCFDDVDLPGGHHGEEGLRVDVRVGEVAAEAGVSHEVGVSRRVTLLNDSGDRCSPLVVAPRVQEALVDCASYEVLLVVVMFLFRKVANVEHIG